MEYTFKYITNRIGEYPKDEMLEMCLNTLNTKNEKNFPRFYVLTLIKWTILYGGRKYPAKKLATENFHKIFNMVASFNEGHISGFIKEKQIGKAFQIIHNQQFYLQRHVNLSLFSTQLKLFGSTEGKYDISQVFLSHTGLRIYDFVYLGQLFWMTFNANRLGLELFRFNGYIDNDLIQLVLEAVPEAKLRQFIKLLLLHPYNAESAIESHRHKLKNPDFQTLEMSFLTLHPFMFLKNQIRLIHASLFDYTMNYYIYDFLKAKDDSFTTEFGKRLERYVCLGLKEIGVTFETEGQLKRRLKESKNQVDYWLPIDNIYIEVKATEMQAYPSVNPTDELIYNSLKSSIFKAYFKQMVPVSKELSPDAENWGIIVTFKEFFYGTMAALANTTSNFNENNDPIDHIPPANVFIIDLYTWDNLIRIVKSGQATLLEILKLAKSNNTKPETTKLLFHMHLKDFQLDSNVELSFLSSEKRSLDIRKTSDWTE